jgi:hypothetical protein
MNTRQTLPVLVLAAALAASGASCPTIPSIEDRVVELATGGSTTLTFVAEGVVNTYNDTQTINLATDFDLASLILDAGIDVSRVTGVKVSGVSYRVTVPDPVAGRSISSTNVTVTREGGSSTPLVTDFSTSVNSATSFTTAPLDPAGVTVLNDILSDLLTSLQNGTPLVNPSVTYSVSGTSNPTDASTNFTWQLKVDMSIKGTVDVEVLN